MANRNGQIYGLTLLSPIIEDETLNICHSMEIRRYLAKLPRDHRSPFARVSSTHLARLVVMDDVVFVGSPACEEHLKSRYLVFETNFDGDLDSYLKRMAQEAPEFVNSVWQHCVDYPGVTNQDTFVKYMKRCQIKTTFFFADVNNKTVEQTLKALQVQAAVGHFVEKNQGKPASEIQKAFGRLLDRIKKAPAPLPGGVDSEKTSAENRPHD
jgi:hypothetical protein